MKLQRRESELKEIETLTEWIQSKKPDSSNPLSLPPLPEKSKVGRIKGNGDGKDSVVFSSYAGCQMFNQLPILKKTKKGLKEGKFVRMTDVQRATLPHSLCGRDILGAAKTGSWRSCTERDGVGCIIILSPTRVLGSQIFGVLNLVGKYHGFSAGLLIGGRKGVDTEKERVNELNILVCTPGRLLQHMDETPNFDCSQLQVLVLDEADCVLDNKFKAAVNAIISQLPTHRQTLLFSVTRTKSVKDLARLSLKDPEYLSVHEEATIATPHLLKETAIIVPPSSEAGHAMEFHQDTFKLKNPGVPNNSLTGISLMCLHAKMNQEQRIRTYSKFCDSRAVLFSTDVASRGLDFNKSVQWEVRAKKKQILSVTPMLAAVLAQFPELHGVAGRAFVTYLKAILKRKDKEVFYVSKLDTDEFAASLGLPMPPELRFLKPKNKETVESLDDVDEKDN
ncbi:DEAD-box ATP-dependent RNA helicase 32-like protein [Drosera capensis]